MTAMEDWTDKRLGQINGNQLLSVTSQDTEDLIGVCVPKASRGVVTARDNGVEKYCYCDDVDIDVVAEMGAVRGTAFDPNETLILNAIIADYSAGSTTEAIRRAVALVGEMLYPALMPGGK